MKIQKKSYHGYISAILLSISAMTASPALVMATGWAGLENFSNFGLECDVVETGSTLTMDFNSGIGRVDFYSAAGWTHTGGVYYSNGPFVSILANSAEGNDISLVGVDFRVGENCSFIASLTAFPAIAGKLLTDMTDISAMTPSITLGMASGTILEQAADEDGWGLKVGLQTNRAYFFFQYTNGIELSVGPYKLKADKFPNKNKSRVIIDPFDPMLYLEGDFLGGTLMKKATGTDFKQTFTKAEGSNDSVAIGVSIKGLLGYESKLPVPTTTDWDSAEAFDYYSFDGHLFLKGKVQLGSLPLTLDSMMVLNFDANDNGWPFGSDNWDWSEWEDNALVSIPSNLINDTLGMLNDTLFGYNGTLAIALKDAPLKYEIKLGEGSVIWDANKDAVMFAAQDIDPPDFSKYTPSIAGVNFAEDITTTIFENNVDVKGYGYIGETNNNIDFRIAFDLTTRNMSFAGNELKQLYAELSHEGVDIQADVRILDMAEAEVRGMITDSNCKLSIKKGSLNLAGYNINNPNINLCTGIIKGIEGIIEVVGYVQVGGEWVYMTGETYSKIAGSTLLHAYNHPMSVVDGSMNIGKLALSTTGGLEATNTVAKYGNKAKQFALSAFNIGSNGLLPKLVSSQSQTSYDSGEVDLSSGGTGIKRVYYIVSGSAGYQLEIEDSKMKVAYNASTRLKGCVKFGFAGKKTTKCDSVTVSTSGNLSTNGCFSTPSKTFKLGWKTFSKKVSIPSKSFCLF